VIADGMSNIDMTASPSAAARTFQTPVQSLSFDLVLPAGSLDPASNYSFKLVGTASSNSVAASATVELVTRSGPFDGHLEVTITY
jgi:hypothetical protein